MNRFVGALMGAALLALASAAAAAMAMLAPDLRSYCWTDSDGQALRLSSLRAPLVVMTMAYTDCRRVCGTTTLVLAELQKRLDAMGAAAEFVVVSYDPANDTPAEWREYRNQRGLTRPNWHFVTGNAEVTRQIAQQLELSFWTYHDHVVHDFRIVLFDARWRVVAEVDWAHLDDVAGILRQAIASAAADRR